MPYIEREGVKVYYESFGEGNAIVFLHPLSTNRYIWSNQAFAFARNHRVVLIDHRGHGLSDKPETGYAIADMAADLIAVLDDAGIEKAVLVGNSIGAMIALQTTLDAPERVNANFIVSSGTNLGPDIPPEVMQAYIEDFAATYEYVLGGATSQKTKQEKSEVCDYLDGVFRIRDNFTRSVFLANITDPGGVFQWDITDQLENIQHPVLIVAGEEDRAIPPGACQLLADKIPQAELKVVADVGHFYPIERPDDFNHELLAFLDHCGLTGD